ncbi:MAG: GNAT family N-acetyltransferase [Bacteroidetes bacterium]|jgi:GNAT superfamily N-acetyltransferase|nr:MAG: GNAT family N-acetyltransferase [Bacteroidota bacterium]UCE69120.1 MAG: GNAT family N-acetyltransferase [Flavobacteriaceae bacterium]
MNKLEIRPARPEDMQEVLELIRELAIFEREPHAVELTGEDLLRDGFGQMPRFKCFVAVANGRVKGMALCYPRYSTWKGLVIHLEDLIVTEAARGQGLGSALLTAVIRYAKEEGARRVSWEVLDWNDPAIDFYEGRGARVLRDWDVVQLDARGIETYLERYENI